MHSFNNPHLYKLKIVVSLIGMLVVLAISCKKEEGYTPPSDPKKAILGKWVLIEMGDVPCSKTEYTEFLSDSLIGIYNYTKKEYQILNYNYWIDDSLLNYGSTSQSGVEIFSQFKYKFYGDKMRLEIINWDMEFNTFTYKRIK